MRLPHSIRALVGIGRLKLTDDTGSVQTAQIDLGQSTGGDGQAVRDKTPLLSHFGFTSRPPKDADAVVVSLNGDRSGGIIIAVGHQTYRLKNLNEGEAALYDMWGNTVVLTEAGIIVTHTDKVRIVAPLLEVTGDIVDQCDSNDVTLQQLRDAYNDHHHTGVTTGGGSTGLTDDPVS